MSMGNNLKIFQMNDSHGYLEQHPELFWCGDHAEYRKAGGYARIASLISGEREDAVLALDCGDTLHGTYLPVHTRGRAMLPVLNSLGLQAMTAHWEFAYGPAAFRSLARGHGRQEDLGSTAERFLLYSLRGDVLIMRSPWRFEKRPIVAAVDGSENSYAALRRAAEMGAALGAEVRALSVYDPFFHSEVFRRIASSLSNDSNEGFDLPAQEKIHDEIIDEGLENLYREGLEKGVRLACPQAIQTRVLAGKICPQILDYASSNQAGLVVVGRFGIHQEPESLIGSNALRLARQSKTNVLVVSPSTAIFVQKEIN